jgi:hypothetical protein
MRGFRRLIVAIALCGLLPAASYGQFDELAAKTQQGANALMAIDVASALATPLAQEKGWSKKLEGAYIDRATFLPPDAKALLITGTLLPDRHFQASAEVAVLKMAGPVSMASIARANGGEVQQLRGRDVIETRSDAYLASLGPDLLATYSPGNRQAVGRWLSDVADKKVNMLSPYLAEALSKVGAKTQIVLAIDLQDAVSATQAASRLQEEKILEGTSYKLNDVVAQLQSLRGATIEIGVAKAAHATTTIEFNEPLKFSGEFAKKLVLASMENLGMELEDLPKHHFSVSGSAIVIEGDLSAGGLRRLLSLVEIPSADVSQTDAAPAASQSSSGDQIAAASLTYFKSVTSLLDDLRGDRVKQSAKGGQDAVWMERYAKKIDALPLLNVDDELLDWGSKIAETMRVMSTTRRTNNLSAGVAKSGLRSGGYIGGYGGSYFGGFTTSRETTANANQIDQTYKNQATAVRIQGWQLIDDATAKIRREETKRYGIEF